jgi:hypothetical protein
MIVYDLCKFPGIEYSLLLSNEILVFFVGVTYVLTLLSLYVRSEGGKRL